MKWILLLCLCASLIQVAAGYGVYAVVQHSPSVCPTTAQEFSNSIYLFTMGYLDDCVWISSSGNSYTPVSWSSVDTETGAFNASFKYYFAKNGYSVCESQLLLDMYNFSSDTLYNCSIALNSEAFSISTAPDILSGIEKFQQAGLIGVTADTDTVGIYMEPTCQTAPRFISIQNMAVNCTHTFVGCYPAANGYYAKRDCFSEIIVNVTVDDQTSGAPDMGICGASGWVYTLCAWLLYLLGAEPSK